MSSGGFPDEEPAPVWSSQAGPFTVGEDVGAGDSMEEMDVEEIRGPRGGTVLYGEENGSRIGRGGVRPLRFKDVRTKSGVYKRKEWFVGGPKFDAECEKKLGEALKLASTGALNEWMTSVRGRLALVILLDQISHNVYRNSAASYGQDQAAVKIILKTIERGWDKELLPSEWWFLYIPLMHFEDMRHHEIVDHLYEELANKNCNNEKLHEDLVAIIEFERKHIVVLKRFERYPTRNAALGRPNTKEEEEFLSSGGGW